MDSQVGLKAVSEQIPGYGEIRSISTPSLKGKEQTSGNQGDHPLSLIHVKVVQAEPPEMMLGWKVLRRKWPNPKFSSERIEVPKVWHS